jgi:type 1 fimbria pilin
MKKQIAILIATAALAFAAGEKQTFTGSITDTMCGGDHRSMNMGADDKCTIACARAGAKFALWNGKATYELSNQALPAKYAGKKVTVKGTLDEKTHTIKVDSISEAK